MHDKGVGRKTGLKMSLIGTMLLSSWIGSPFTDLCEVDDGVMTGLHTEDHVRLSVHCLPQALGIEITDHVVNERLA